MSCQLHFQTRRLTRGIALCIAASLIAAVVVSLTGPHPRGSVVFTAIALALLVPLYAVNVD